MIKIPVNAPLLNGNEKKYLNKCISDSFVSSSGPFVNKFEKKFAKFIGKKYAVSVSNGTVALQIAYECLNIKKKDEVILPSFTIISCILPIIKSGGVPVLVDSNIDDWNINVNEIKKKITTKTKCIIVPHLYGLPAEIDKIKKICKKKKIKIIEDTAEAIGLKYKGKMCGSYGDLSTFSFYANKHITTGEGGMICTDNKSYYDKCRYLRNLCFNNQRRFKHYDIGYNARFTNIQSALGLAQLEQINKFIKKKISIGEFYNKKIKANKSFVKPILEKNETKNIYWVYGLLIKNKKLKLEKVRDLFKKNGIETRNFFWPLHLQPILNKMGYFKNQKFKNAEYLGKKGFYIPSGLGLKINQQRIIVKFINKFFD
jgi:perosamine synthetase